MKLFRVKPGAVLGADVKVPSPLTDVQYLLRLEAGTELTQNHLDRLRRANVSSIPIKDDDTNDLDKYIHDAQVEAAEDEVRSAFENFTEELGNQDFDPKSLSKLKEAISSLIDALSGSELMAAYTTLKDHDNYTAEHSLDVAKITLQFTLENEKKLQDTLVEESGASRTSIQRNMLKDLGLGAMLHDLGKREVDSEILNKPSGLTKTEMNEVKNHPHYGYENLKAIASHMNAPVRIPAYHHHEKFDGSGYPQGLEGKEIHLFGRISVFADVYSALTSVRPYRDPLEPSQALEVMKLMQQEGPHFDPMIYERYLTLIMPYPGGQEVSLSDGRRGVVCEVDSDSPHYPKVRILYENGNRLDSPQEIQLEDDPQSPTIVDDESGDSGLCRA
ncbi:MAG: HD-GYP domain-containing protein [bacterium]